MYSYSFSEKAKEDLFRIYNYGVHKFGFLQADKYYEMIYDCFDKIAANPQIFPVAVNINENYRCCVCGSDTIYYRIIDHNNILLVTIIGRQNFGNSLESK